MVRQRYIDCVAGFLIIRVVLLHCFHYSGIIHAKYLLLLYPSMPWFFYKSGMFYRRSRTREVIKKGVQQFIVPLLLFSVLGIIVRSIRVFIQDNISWDEYLHQQLYEISYGISAYGNLPLWFFFVLFAVKCLYFFLSKKVNKIILFAVCFFISISLYYSPFDYPYFLASIPMGFIFYGLGSRLKDIQHCHAVVASAVFVYIIVSIAGWTVVDMHWNKCLTGQYLLWIPTSLSYIILMNNFFKMMPKIRLLEWIGKNSLIIFVTHCIILELMVLLSRDIIGIENHRCLFPILVMSEIFLLPVVIRLLSCSKLSWTVGIYR